MNAPISFATVCSGIGAPEQALVPMGWRRLWAAETDAASARVLRHWHSGPNLGDMTTIAARVLSRDVEAPDVLVGGTPCQSFSIAGHRKGLSDARGDLSLAFVALANAIDDVRSADGRAPCAVWWENVPGVFSDRSNAFGAFLGELVGGDAALVPPRRFGWARAGVAAGPVRTAAWRVLDAQFFGLAQRRNRVYVLARGGAGDWTCADALLPIIDGLRWHPAPRRQAREGAAAHAARGVAIRGRDGGGTAELGDDLAGTLRASKGGGDKPHVLTCIHGDSVARTGKATTPSADATGAVRLRDPGKGFIDDETAYALTTGQPNVLAFTCKDGGADAGDVAPTMRAMNHSASHANGGGQLAVACVTGDRSHALTAEGHDASEDGTGRGTPIASQGGTFVRRLTPTECERLQGFPDGYTDVAGAADGPRYRQIGDSMAVPVMRAIGHALDRALRA